MNRSPINVRTIIEQIYAAALKRSDPRVAVREIIRVSDASIEIADQRYPTDTKIVVVAIGKAAVTMAQGALDALGDRLSHGIAITKDGHSLGVELPRFEVYEASHPIPDERGVAATRRAIEIVESCGPNDLVLALISGGGSALFEAPVPPVALEDMASITNALLRAGAAIDELNAVRTPLSQVKGGGLLARAAHTRMQTLIVSDVLGNDPRVIASGPTVPGVRDLGRARQILQDFSLWESAPLRVKDVLSSDVPGLGEAHQLRSVSVIADNRVAVETAAAEANEIGLHAEIVWIDRTGEAREQAAIWIAACESADSAVDCLVGGGELTVTVAGDGIGGRNTEFALAAGIELQRRANRDWVIASLATDGQDGPTGVAGGFIDLQMIESLHDDPGCFLDKNDSLTPLYALNATIAPGPTGTNVNDLYLAIRTNAIPRI